MAHAELRPGLIDRLKAQSGVQTDDAFARLIGVSRSTLVRVRDGGESPSAGFIAGIAVAFGLGLGEVALAAEGEELAVAS